MSALAKSIAATALLLFACTTTARSDAMMWFIQNTTASPLGAVLYSKSRPAAWPGNNGAYTVPNDRRVYSLPLDCAREEQICYGAWVLSNPKLSWGVGPWNIYGCANCCYVCRQETTAQVLLDRTGCRVGPSVGDSSPTFAPRSVVKASLRLAFTTCDDLVLPSTPTPGPAPTCNTKEDPWCDLKYTPLPPR